MEAFIPNTADDVCELHFMGMIREVKSVTVRRVAGEKYPEIVGYGLGDYPLDRRGTGNGEQGTDEDGWEDYDDLPF